MFKHSILLKNPISIIVLIFLMPLNSLLGQTYTQTISKTAVPLGLENISVTTLFSDSLSSSFVIWVKHEVKAHKHIYHAEQVYVLEGKGMMKVADKEFIIQTGDIIYIPKNTLHSVIVTSDTPIKVISFQAPKYDGTDRIFVD